MVEIFIARISGKSFSSYVFGIGDDRVVLFNNCVYLGAPFRPFIAFSFLHVSSLGVLFLSDVMYFIREFLFDSFRIFFAIALFRWKSARFASVLCFLYTLKACFLSIALLYFRFHHGRFLVPVSPEVRGINFDAALMIRSRSANNMFISLQFRSLESLIYSLLYFMFIVFPVGFFKFPSGWRFIGIWTTSF